MFLAQNTNQVHSLVLARFNCPASVFPIVRIHLHQSDAIITAPFRSRVWRKSEPRHEIVGGNVGTRRSDDIGMFYLSGEALHELREYTISSCLDVCEHPAGVDTFTVGGERSCTEQSDAFICR